jgi:hypothetical protein
MEKEQSEFSETLAFKLQTTGNNPPKNIRRRNVLTKIYRCGYNASLVVTITVIAKKNFRTAAILPSFFKQKYLPHKNAYSFKNLGSHNLKPSSYIFTFAMLLQFAGH